jgi:hypothetical protein
MRASLLAALCAVAIVGSMTMSRIATADEHWTEEQLEVIGATKSCWLAESKKAWLENCYHEGFVGWYKDNPHVITIADKRGADAAEWTDYSYELVEFTPYKVHIDGDMAATVYSAQLQWTEIATGVVTVGEKQRWMEALVRENGRWLGIAEHASLMPKE